VQIAERQNSVNRSQSLYEEFLYERCLRVNNAEGEPDRKARYQLRRMTIALRKYVEDRKLTNSVPSQAQLRLELEALGVQIVNPDNVLTAIGLCPRDDADEI
jgi:hypothetical protein